MNTAAPFDSSSPRPPVLPYQLLWKQFSFEYKSSCPWFYISNSCECVYEVTSFYIAPVKYLIYVILLLSF